MVKAIVMFTEITDLQEFENYFVNTICPHLLRLSGIERIDITSVFPMGTEIVQDVKGLQLIIEVVYESYSAMDRIIQSPEGQIVTELANQIPSGKMSIFMGKEKSIFPYGKQPEPEQNDK